MIDREHEAAVLEMGMNHFGEMHRLSRMARPTHCVFTNIGVAHLEYLGSRDGILKAKMEMLDYAAPDAGIFINGDDDKLAVMKDRAVTFGLKKTNQIYADQIENLGLDGIRCRIRTPEGDIHAAIPIPGMHMVYNAMAGTCVGQSLGLNSEEIEAGIRSLSALPGRGIFCIPLALRCWTTVTTPTRSPCAPCWMCWIRRSPAKWLSWEIWANWEIRKKNSTHP